MARAQPINTRLAALITETGLSHASVARAFVRVALENGGQQFAGVGRSHVSHWVAGTKPSGHGAVILAETLSRALGRRITPRDIGLDEAVPTRPGGVSRFSIDWCADSLSELADLGRDDVDLDRRQAFGAAAYSVAGLALPGDSWWHQMPERSQGRPPIGPRVVGQGDVDAVADMVSLFSRIDQRHGGGHARSAAVRYLTTDVETYLHGTFRNDSVRRSLFSTVGELAYLVGWMAFDNAEHAVAQRFFTVAVKLAAEAQDPALAGHVLRAMAHQAVDLGHPRQALDLAGASVDGLRYTLATPRERALLGVVHARTLALAGQRKSTATALLRAEDDLAKATTGDDDPARVFFFGEASLAHETACTLRDIGDLEGAAAEFTRSVRTRNASTFTRTHAVTLGYLGAVQIRQGDIERACTTWSGALDAMDGVRSGRTRQVAADMRRLLSPFQQRTIRAVGDVASRAKAYLSEVA